MCVFLCFFINNLDPFLDGFTRIKINCSGSAPDPRPKVDDVARSGAVYVAWLRCARFGVPVLSPSSQPQYKVNCSIQYTVYSINYTGRFFRSLEA